MLLLALKRAWPYLVCVALGFAAAWYLMPAPEPTVVERVVEKVVEAKREATTVKHTTVKTTKPDGTVVERAEDKTQTVEQEHTEASSDTQVSVAPAPAKTRYSLGLEYLPSLGAAPSMRDTRIELGARLGDSNAWATGGYDVKDKQVSLGLRYEW